MDRKPILKLQPDKSQDWKPLHGAWQLIESKEANTRLETTEVQGQRSRLKQTALFLIVNQSIKSHLIATK